MATTSWSDRPPGLVRILRADIGAILAPIEPDLVYLYGSILTGLAHGDSDVDLAILCADADAATQYRRRLWARHLVREAFMSNRLDVGDLRHTDSVHYQVHVVTKGLCLYERVPGGQRAFEDQVLRHAAEPASRRAVTWEAIKARYREELAAETGLIERDKLEKCLWQSIRLLEFLVPYRAMPPSRFFSPTEFEHRFAAGHVLRTLLESVLTIGRHLILALGWSRAFQPRDIIRILAQQGVVQPDLTDDLALVLTLREPLTWSDSAVDWQLVHDAVTHRLDVFTRFYRQVILYLERLGL